MFIASNCCFLVEGCRSPYHSRGLVPFGATVKVSCNPGFILTGAEAITCLDSGQFDVRVPECLGTVGLFILCFRVFVTLCGQV